jgi:hypothetical protein
MTQDRENCAVCGRRFRMEDAVGILEHRLVHARCLPKTPRFTDGLDLDDPDPDGANH